MASFVLSFFPLDVLDEIWDLIESVSEGFLTYSYQSEIDLLHTKSKVISALLSKLFLFYLHVVYKFCKFKVLSYDFYS